MSYMTDPDFGSESEADFVAASSTKHEASEAGNDSEKPASEPVSADRLRAMAKVDRAPMSVTKAEYMDVARWFNDHAPDLAEWAADAAEFVERVAPIGGHSLLARLAVLVPADPPAK